MLMKGFDRKTITSANGYTRLKQSERLAWKNFNRDIMEDMLKELDDFWKDWNHSQEDKIQKGPEDGRTKTLKKVLVDLDQIEHDCVAALKRLKTDLSKEADKDGKSIYDWADRLFTFMKTASNKEHNVLATFLGQWKVNGGMYSYPGVKKR